ncbi:MAG: DUF6691 family protein [Kofleriaceae bacterium]
MKIALAALGGVVFAIGLLVSDMTSPARIIGFLDVLGRWDPTLAFVMAGAIAVHAPFIRLAHRRPHPLFAQRFHWPEPARVDVALVAGSILFGIGWGLSGYCPGPALVALGAGATGTLVFVGCVIAGIAITRIVRPRS